MGVMNSSTDELDCNVFSGLPQLEAGGGGHLLGSVLPALSIEFDRWLCGTLPVRYRILEAGTGAHSGPKIFRSVRSVWDSSEVPGIFRTDPGVQPKDHPPGLGFDVTNDHWGSLRIVCQVCHPFLPVPVSHVSAAQSEVLRDTDARPAPSTLNRGGLGLDSPTGPSFLTPRPCRGVRRKEKGCWSTCPGYGTGHPGIREYL